MGDPWSVLPVKNAKYARDLIEVHLSDREIDVVQHFEDFPNLEVIWLNNNKVGVTDFSHTSFLLLNNLIVIAENLGWDRDKLPREEGLRLR